MLPIWPGIVERPVSVDETVTSVAQKAVHLELGLEVFNRPPQVIRRVVVVVEMDLYLARFDVIGSLVHIQMLESINLLTKDELTSLSTELKNIYEEIEKGYFKIENNYLKSLVLLLLLIVKC